MGWVPIVLALSAAFLSRGGESRTVFWLAVATALLGFWSWGVMHNRPYSAASRRRDAAVARMRSDGLSDAQIRASGLDKVVLTSADIDLAPTWVAWLHGLSWIAAITLLIVALL